MGVLKVILCLPISIWQCEVFARFLKIQNHNSTNRNRIEAIGKAAGIPLVRLLVRLILWNILPFFLQKNGPLKVMSFLPKLGMRLKKERRFLKKHKRIP